MSDLVFLDTETTGLDPALHEVWEIAFAVGERSIASGVIPHSLRTADPEALAMNGYVGRGLGVAPDPWLDVELKRLLVGATIVGSNPAFDTAFLRARWGVAPWHHRMVAVESMAMQEFGWERPKGLKDVATALRGLNFDIPEPDHTAAGDVATLRAVFNALQEVAR